ncbi:Bug family tripartite tricarboxylate transporter substrate binding protein [Cupriavidus necator]|uniref:Bug family tripartite tricarboxylate transporter substrate binding protein n=1 Tax=Cupriavidus necator TaxID=106590 RepID=UPI0005B3E484|nr:tripartite tricarboxylate transporter substrate binding protein [Cupriavidus necator]
MTGIHRALLLAASVATACFSGSTFAQRYPGKTISIVVAYPAGGDTDMLARVFAEKLSTRLGQSVVVENRPGATGVIGSSYVAKAAPDGYTLLLTPGSISFAQLVLKTGPNSGYDALNGFTPIVQVGSVPLFLVAGSGSGFKSFKDVVSAAKSRTVSFATAGTGSIHHILGEVVNKATGVHLEHVPYKGVAPAINDVLGGHIPMTYISLGTVKPYLESGKLVPLAVMDRERTPLAPNIPTLQESGYKVEMNTWYGLFGPKGMSPAVVKTLNEHMNEILKMPEVLARMSTLGAVPIGGSPETLAKANAADYERFGRIIKDLHIQAD